MTNNQFTEPTIDLWESVWKSNSIPRVSHPALIEIIKKFIDPLHARILEVGCGSGVDSAELANLGFNSFILDYSISALRQAKQQFGSRNLIAQPVAGDVFSLPFDDESFDLVFSQGLIEHFHNPFTVIEEQSRVIKYNGYLLVDVPQTFSIYTIHKHKQMHQNTWFAGWETNYSLPQLERLLAKTGLQPCGSYGYLYYPDILTGLRNLHSLDERRELPIWIKSGLKKKIENLWVYFEKKRWYYRWLVNIGVIARKIS